ncbi:MAG: NAD-dependent epimerase/dehydratase family protein [Kineosporiaceae bacterium]|nr:NAD-dependent epimerase/dehydratase family protein [Kineosporiaceae bacterium]MBK7621985.1 NAD-dependent epimerase/dehydratase family protein [Kineosporiaceae bacterium]MBK8074297.1 NAD-dependent epimerase/dehydratase family protein [Kineosporiaceae bacterium]
MRLLVTGGSGFIGSAVVRAALTAGHEVRVLDQSGGDAPGGPEVEVVHGDVRDADLVESALAGVDAVSHQAAKVGLGVNLDDMPDYASVNDVGTAVLLAAMARQGVGHLVLASSMVIYGEGGYRCPEHGPIAAPPRQVADLAAGRFDPLCPRCRRPLEPTLVGEDAVPDPRNAYAASKVAQEHLARIWARECSGTLTALRYHNVYGPGMPRDTPYAGVAAIFRSALAHGEAPRVFEDGGQRRDFVHVDDVAAANLAALTAQTGDETTARATEQSTAQATSRLAVYNVASGVQRTVGELAATLAEVMSGPPPVVTGEFRLGDVRHVTADTARIRSELGWRPRVDFRDGIAQLAAAST